MTTIWLSIAVLALLSLADASLLRGKIHSILYDASQEVAIVQQLTSGSFECEVLELDGMTPPGEEELEHEFACVVNSGDDFKTYFFDGDIEKRFGADIPEIGRYSMSIPWSAVSDSNIDTAHEGISVIEGSKRRRRLAAKVGKHKVLIVRVVAIDSKPSKWKAELFDDFFSDGNNLVSRNLSFTELLYLVLFEKSVY